MAPTPAPQLQKGSDAPWPPVHQGEDEAPKASGAPPAGMDSAVESQARASPQEGTEAQGAGLGPGIENRDSSNSLEGQKPKVEEGGAGDRAEASGVDVCVVSLVTSAMGSSYVMGGGTPTDTELRLP